jgi:tetratricopeptide (TPR) repeat protein
VKLVAFLRNRPLTCIALLLVAAGLAVFSQTVGHDFVNYDDHDYVASNPHVQMGLTKTSVVWAFTSTEQANWHPLTWLSHMADVQLYGRKPWGQHLTNVLLHILNTLLLFLVLRRMTGFAWRSAFIAAVFAVHPLHVESVAWIAERKDVLSATFWMLTLLAYVRYVDTPNWKRYLAVAILYALGLMAKPMLVSLPLILLLLDYWPLDRLNPSRPKPRAGFVRLMVEKLPLVALAGASCAVTYFAQRTEAMEISGNLTLGMRLSNAVVSYVEYIIKAMWPARLSVHYQHPENTLPAWQVYGATIFLLCVCVLAVRYRRHAPYLFVGWFWYLIALLPVIGLVQVGSQAMADRYMYIPLIGLAWTAAWAAGKLCDKEYDAKHSGPRRHVSSAVIGAGLVILISLAYAARVQAGYWRDSVSLFSHAVEATPGNARAEALLAAALNDRGDLKGALAHYSKSVRIRPTIASRQSELGLLLIRLGRPNDGLAHCRAAVRLAPRNAGLRNNLGVAFLGLGKPQEALKHYQEALQLDPTYGEAHNNIAIRLFYVGRYREAWREVRLSRKYGVEPHPGFIAALTRHMPGPQPARP